jgi:uncharacterized membrane protein YfcA
VTVLTFTLVVFLGALLAGLVGSLTGLGGGVIIIPMLTLVFHIDIRYAIGTSLISVIATSSGAASAYVKEGISNIRLGMFLEIATTFGAVIGALLAVYTPTALIEILFALILIISAGMSLKDKKESIAKTESKWSRILRLGSTYPTPQGEQGYTVQKVPAGFGMMALAGIISGLLGIGSGALKVIAMDTIMKIPFKVSTATSNFMIGVTAAASAGIYLLRGYIDPGISMPVMLGVLVGALIGSKLLVRANTVVLRIVFAILIVFLAVQMIYKGLTSI